MSNWRKGELALKARIEEAFTGDTCPADYSACWSIGLMPSDENIPIPDWPVSFRLTGRPGYEYSAEMTIEVPGDAVVAMVSE